MYNKCMNLAQSPAHTLHTVMSHAQIRDVKGNITMH